MSFTLILLSILFAVFTAYDIIQTVNNYCRHTICIINVYDVGRMEKI